MKYKKKNCVGAVVVARFSIIVKAKMLRFDFIFHHHLSSFVFKEGIQTWIIIQWLCCVDTIVKLIKIFLLPTV